MATLTSEKTFETAIEEHLLAHEGYVKGRPAGFDPSLGLFPVRLVAFLQATQPKEWERLQAIYAADVSTKVVQFIARSIDERGTLDVLRHGVTDRGVKLQLAYFKPASGLNPDTVRRYQQNVLAITRQVHFSPKDPALSIDVVIDLNGIPVATAELKNPFTGQTVVDARKQYEQRDHTVPLFRFKTGALVHFAVDADEVYMTTRLAGQATEFLPFNKGRDGGRGNPDNPSGWKTAYLWEEILAGDSWLDLLARFIHLEIRETTRDGVKSRSERLIFPRYHQLDAVRRILAAARTEGAGHDYLAQHSAGSGKSNTIGWLAHRLSNLHDDQNQPVFDSVVVITDRRVLDSQLQNTIYQFEHKQGVVKKIDQDSAQLAEALTAGTPIIITTLQKFSFVLDKVSQLPSRRYAVIVDEAHSSQTGESATHLREVLGAGSLDEAERADTAEDADEQDAIEAAVQRAIRARGPQQNLSFFAFTATPKAKTLERFGRTGTDGKPHAFHLYSMRQAIEEGFILDVLSNYTTYATYFRLTKAVEDDPELNREKALRAVARFVSLHPHNLAQKTEVMVEHFRSVTRKKIGGRAKAMVITRSRLHAVRYKQAFEAYIREKGYDHGQDALRVLVAFSGTVHDSEDGQDYTEPRMNVDIATGRSMSEAQLPDRFASDDYQVLLVAEKYQTGFDQPLLHTMYVDRPLSGLHAVQTLSRLNRTHPGKEDTFVLDFCNSVEEIREAFRPWYEATAITEQVDPNKLYSLKHKLDASQIYWQQDVLDFAKVFFKDRATQRAQDQGKLYAAVDPAVARFKAQPETAREDFRHDLTTFIRLYDFLSNIIDFQDADLERLYAFGRLLLAKLPSRDEGHAVLLDQEVKLAYYRLQKTAEGSASLHAGDSRPVAGPTSVGTGRPTEDETVALSHVIDVLNERFQTDFTKEDRLLFDQWVGDLAADEDLHGQAQVNSLDQFAYAFDPKAMAALIERLERNEKISSVLMGNEKMRSVVLEWVRREVYDQARSSPSEGLGV